MISGLRILSIALLLSALPSLVVGGETLPWQALSRVGQGKSHLVPAFWGSLPRLTAKARIRILDVDGPGVVNNIHGGTANMSGGAASGFNAPPADQIIIRVYYDRQEKPAIEMPLLDFLGDIEGKSAYFSTVFFSKVKESHNFLIPMPFRKHITIEVENPTDQNIDWIYMDMQWDKVAKIPSDSGYLHCDYRKGTLSTRQPNIVFQADSAGTVVAHWLQFECEKSSGGEGICEADLLMYLDNDKQPGVHYGGSEDAYGFSWGYKGIQNDHYCAILRQDVLQPAGTRIAVLRCRATDAISFKASCRWNLTYENDSWVAGSVGDSPILFRHCVYYYAQD